MTVTKYDTRQPSAKKVKGFSIDCGASFDRTWFSRQLVQAVNFLLRDFILPPCLLRKYNIANEKLIFMNKGTKSSLDHQTVERLIWGVFPSSSLAAAPLKARSRRSFLLPRSICIFIDPSAVQNALFVPRLASSQYQDGSAKRHLQVDQRQTPRRASPGHYHRCRYHHDSDQSGREARLVDLVGEQVLVSKALISN